MFATDHVSAGEHALADRGGADDGGAGRYLLPQLPAPPATITLDIDDTCDPVHGHQQLSLFNAHYDTRCFLPIHVYHVEGVVRANRLEPLCEVP